MKNINIGCPIFAITPLEWKVGHSSDKSKAPSKYVPAQVPGAVQLDIARAEKYPPYEYADNYKMFSWMEDRFYTYLSYFKKPVYDAISASCRPVLASARFSKFQRNEGEDFFADIFVLNDTFKEIPSLKIQVKLKPAKGEEVIMKWETPVAESNTNVAGPTVRFRLPYWENTGRFEVILDVEGHPEYSSSYTLLYKPAFKPYRGTKTLNM